MTRDHILWGVGGLLVGIFVWPMIATRIMPHAAA